MKRGGPVRFKWIELNRAKIDRHDLSETEVEFAWKHRFGDNWFAHHGGPYFESYGPCPNGRIILIVWRWNSRGTVQVVYVITAYGSWKLR